MKQYPEIWWCSQTNEQRGRMLTSSKQDSNCYIFLQVKKVLWYVKKIHTVKVVFTGSLFAWCPALNETIAPYIKLRLWFNNKIQAWCPN